MSIRSPYLKLERAQHNKVYQDLLKVVFDGFEKSDEPLDILDNVATKGAQYIEHPDWLRLQEIIKIHKHEFVTDDMFEESISWCRDRLSNGKYCVLTCLSYDDWLLIPNVCCGISPDLLAQDDCKTGPHCIPPILRDVARVSVGWYPENIEMSYSEQERQDQKRQGKLTRVVKKGDKHLVTIALHPAIMWACGYFNRFVVQTLQPIEDRELITVGGFHDGDVGFTGTFLGEQLCSKTTFLAERFDIAYCRDPGGCKHVS